MARLSIGWSTSATSNTAVMTTVYWTQTARPAERKDENVEPEDRSI